MYSRYTINIENHLMVGCLSHLPVCLVFLIRISFTNIHAEFITNTNHRTPLVVRLYHSVASFQYVIRNSSHNGGLKSIWNLRETPFSILTVDKPKEPSNFAPSTEWASILIKRRHRENEKEEIKNEW